MGCIEPFSRDTQLTPPMPIATASWDPKVSDLSLGMISAMRVGLQVKSVASHKQSASTKCTALEILTRVP
jgi:hypothetical protein